VAYGSWGKLCPGGPGGSGDFTLGVGFERFVRHLGSAVPYISGWNALDRR
jgi:hypothetical protein